RVRQDGRDRGHRAGDAALPARRSADRRRVVPVTDTHAHLDACADPPDLVLGRAREAGVERVISVGSGLDSCHATLDLARQKDGVWAALGIHPHQAADDDANRLGEPRAVAVGETGLDFYRDYAPRDRQHDLFARELELAADLGKAVVVHTRD